jgi:PTS system nitrogen regulatory IIA component
MTIAELLAPENVLLDMRAADKRQLLGKLARHLAPGLDVDPEAAAAALAYREELGSTGMGEGIALPHARLARISRATGLLARLRPALDFDAVDGRPVDLAFLLLLPEQDRGLGLNGLACVARRLRVPAVADPLRRARTSDEAYAILTSEARLSGER